jgi:hypothetical protein
VVVVVCLRVNGDRKQVLWWWWLWLVGWLAGWLRGIGVAIGGVRSGAVRCGSMIAEPLFGAWVNGGKNVHVDRGGELYGWK